MDTKKKNSKPKKSQNSNLDPLRWGKTVRVSKEIVDLVEANGQYGETFSDVLKRLINRT